MECMRALELDGKVETVKPLAMGHFDLGDDEPGPSKRRKTEDGDSDSDFDIRKEKEKEKLKARAKEKKRKARAKEKKEKERKEKEKKKRKKEKKKAEEKKKRKKKEKKKRAASDSDDDSDSDSDSDDELREVDAPKKKRKRTPSVSSAASASSSSSSSSSGSGSDADSDSDASSVDTDDIDDEDVPFRPEASGLPAVMSNPFDLSDTQIVYRATRLLDNSVMLGQMHTPCGRCPQFTFCEESGPVNAEECKYYTGWLGDQDKSGGWERGTALHKMRPELREEDEPVEGVEKANGAAGTEPNGNHVNGANGDAHEEAIDVDEAPVDEAEEDVEEPVADDE
jgi:DNA-directed RNA polymerase III subunit RPC6